MEARHVYKLLDEIREDVKTLRFEQQAMQNELFILFINKMQETYPARVHDRLLKQIYGQQTESF